MIPDSTENINVENEDIPPPPHKDDFIRIAEVGMSERDIEQRYPHVVIYGPPDDRYVSRSELEEGDDA